MGFFFYFWIIKDLQWENSGAGLMPSWIGNFYYQDYIQDSQTDNQNAGDKQASKLQFVDLHRSAAICMYKRE